MIPEDCKALELGLRDEEYFKTLKGISSSLSSGTSKSFGDGDV